jgi:hypothetical protein
LILRFTRRYPRASVSVMQTPVASLHLLSPRYHDLRERRVDMLVSRRAKCPSSCDERIGIPSELDGAKLLLQRRRGGVGSALPCRLNVDWELFWGKWFDQHLASWRAALHHISKCRRRVCGLNRDSRWNRPHQPPAQFIPLTSTRSDQP